MVSPHFSLEAVRNALSQHDDIKLISLAADGVSIIILFEEDVYGVRMDTNNVDEPGVYRYIGFNIISDLPNSNETYQAIASRYKAGSVHYLASVLKVRNSDLLPECLKNYILKNPSLFFGGA